MASMAKPSMVSVKVNGLKETVSIWTVLLVSACIAETACFLIMPGTMVVENRSSSNNRILIAKRKIFFRGSIGKPGFADRFRTRRGGPASVRETTVIATLERDACQLFYVI